MSSTQEFKFFNLFGTVIFVSADGSIYTSNKRCMYLIKNDSKRGEDDLEYTCDGCYKVIEKDEFSYSCEIDDVDICIRCRISVINSAR